MTDQENEATAAAPQKAERVVTQSGGVDINPLAIPLRASYRKAVNALMAYFDAHGIPYSPRNEEIGICLTVRGDIPHWQTSSRIRLGACTGVVTIYTWTEQFLVTPQCAWKAKRLVDAVNAHCGFAELGYDAATQQVYARTQVWYADTELRPRDVELAMHATGVVLLRTLQELFEISAYRKRIEASVEVLVRWLREEEMRAVVEVAEVEVEVAGEAAV